VQALVTKLHESHVLTPESTRSLLLELASLCRYEDMKVEIVSHGLDTLVLRMRDQDGALVAAEVLEVGLELLVNLMFENHSARVRLTQKGVVELSLLCLSVYSSKKQSKRRNKVMKLAIEVLDSIASADDERLRDQQLHTVAVTVQILENMMEDPCVLLHAVQLLGCLLEGNLSNIMHAANLRAISTLFRILGPTSEKMELNRAVCEVLLRIAEAPGMAQIMAAENGIHSLCLCLYMKGPSRDVEHSATRLLLRLSENTHVYGQIINEEMVPLLFQVVERNSAVLDVAWSACAVLEGLAKFARDCKLDLSPFLTTVHCQGKLLIQTAVAHAHETSLVTIIFQFFVHLSYNPVDLPSILNSETIEGLLGLYITNGTSGFLSVLADHIVQILTMLSRSTIESLRFSNEDQTLPSLFLCLRGYQDDVRFASQIFAVLTKFWKSQISSKLKSAHSITGFVGIAIDILQRAARTSTCHREEVLTNEQMIEFYNFLREVLLSRDGAEVVNCCGGPLLYHTLASCAKRAEASQQSTSHHGSPELERLVTIVISLLEKSLSTTGKPEQTRTTEENNDMPPLFNLNRGTREGDKEYDAYTSRLLRKERSCLFRSYESLPSLEASTTTGMISISNTQVARASRKSLAEDDNEHRIDHQDDHESEPEDPEPQDTRSCDKAARPDSAEPGNEKCDNGDFVGDGGDEANDDGSNDDSEEGDRENDKGFESELFPMCQSPSIERLFSATPKARAVTRATPKRPNYANLQDMRFYFVDKKGIKYPKHPLRPRETADNDGSVASGNALLFDEPPFLEPSTHKTPEEASTFIASAMERRAAFMQEEETTRARLVYENFSTFNLEEGLVRESLVLTEIFNPEQYPYRVPEQSAAFSTSKSLTFDSYFESGNLERAIQIGDNEYDLVLRRDPNTFGHMQWFYFAVSNVFDGSQINRETKYRFNIVNLCKPDSLFNKGLRPVVYSVKDAAEKGIGWLRAGEDIHYFANPFSRPTKIPNKSATPPEGSTGSTSGPTYYTLTFTLEFPNEGDTYLIAHSYPYTLTDHHRHVDDIFERLGRRARFVISRSALCKSISGRQCDLLTITDFASGSQELKARKAIILTSRVHPGEAQSSWMMRGVLEFLTGDSETARLLRRLFVFEIVPMLNPDGVYFGNSRCGLSACDLNRQWSNPSKAFHPTIYHAKELVLQAYSSRGIIFFCDMHGHSRKQNVFMYGCDTKKRPNPRARTFAKIFSTQHTARSYISYDDCSFKVSRDKENTARVVISSELKLCWSFTLEASFCGSNFGHLEGMHFNTMHMQQVGISLCEALLQACIIEGSTRERLMALVDDYSVCFPGYIESQMRETGIISGGNGVQIPREVNTTPRKPKSGVNKLRKSNSQKLPRRKSSNSTPTTVDDSSKIITQQQQPQQRSQMQRKNSKTGSSKFVDATPVVCSVVACKPLDLTKPPAKLVGKKLKSKKKKSKINDEDVVLGAKHVSTPPTAVNSESIEDEWDSARRESNSGGSASSNSTSTSVGSSFQAALSPSRLFSGPPTTCLIAQSPEQLKPRSNRSTSCLNAEPSSLQPHGEQPPIMFPPPMSDLLQSRSPKLRATNLRLRGGGKQFIAISPVRKISFRDIVHKSELTTVITYDQDVLNASTMALRQRGTLSTTTFPTRPIKLSNSSSTSRYLNFPNVT
ncbi:TPA: hypothetical protein N0F65_002870, partial [Lagenidium giganteum]